MHFCCIWIICLQRNHLHFVVYLSVRNMKFYNGASNKIIMVLKFIYVLYDGSQINKNRREKKCECLQKIGATQQPIWGPIFTLFLSMYQRWQNSKLETSMIKTWQCQVDTVLSRDEARTVVKIGSLNFEKLRTTTIRVFRFSVSNFVLQKMFSSTHSW